jgi:hypothetical protein
MLSRLRHSLFSHAASLLPSFTSFSAFIVPCRACLWFLRNLGSVPFREGYLCVFGFLMLHGESVDNAAICSAQELAEVVEVLEV